MMSSLTEKMIELELHMKYPGEDLSEIDREYNVLSERLRALELMQRREIEEARGVDLAGRWTQNKLVKLAANFRAHISDFNHFINEHFLPLQSKIFTWFPGCGCAEYFRLNPVPSRPTCSPAMGREFITIFPPTPPRSRAAHSSSPDSVPSLWSVTDSEDDKGNKDFEDAPEGSASNTVVSTNGGTEGDTVFAGGLGRDAWELFGRTGVREDSLWMGYSS
jgi:hypothetical protein